MNKRRSIVLPIALTLAVPLLSLLALKWGRLRDLTRLSSGVYLVIAFAAVSVWEFYKCLKYSELKKRCTVRVQAVCAGTAVKRYRRSTMITAAYEYEYMGKTYRGCNNAQADSSELYIAGGDKAEIYINPECLPDDIYDNITEWDKNHSLSSGLGIMAILVFISFLFRFIIF